MTHCARAENQNLFVITGGPGAGKTTLLRELERRGFCCSQEVAREIIREQVAANGDALPWANTARYTELMLERSISAYLEHACSQMPAFFDRGIPDAAAYARLIGLPFSNALKTACEQYRYNTTVFLAPPWEEIYTTDTERKQTWKEAVTTHQTLLETYTEFGYCPIELPKTSPSERAEFVLAHAK